MKTVKALVSQLTDPSALIQNVKDALQELDPQYADVAADYARSAEALRTQVGMAVLPGADAYLTAVDQKIMAELMYVCFLGFQLNLDCFNAPINGLFLQQDFEDIHREYRMLTLPTTLQPTRIMDDFQRALPAHQQALTDGVSNYYSYLQTVGYKLAHYYGFLLAASFLPHVVPGYASNRVLTSQYKSRLQCCLGINLDKLER